jgi:RNA binding exosome subunit
MDATLVREELTEVVMEKLEQSHYLHVGLMDRIEGRITTRDELERYRKILMAKVKETNYRSETMLDRIDGVTGLLERLDKQPAQYG